MQNLIKSESIIKHEYATIKITRSRIEKGLIAIPQSLISWFPASNMEIKIYLGVSGIMQLKQYSSFSSSTREARIGGMKQWFTDMNFSDGDEIVIQILDKNNNIYRIIKEKDFIDNVGFLRQNLENSKDDEEAATELLSLSNLVNKDIYEIAISEYVHLLTVENETERELKTIDRRVAKGKVPPNIKLLLGTIYYGHCQLCNFNFLKRNGRPYFEIHHIKPNMGNFLRNLILVCANCHRQFEYSRVGHFFSDDRWLTKVTFNERECLVNNIVKKETISIPFKITHMITS